MLNFLSFVNSHIYAWRMVPVSAIFTLDHKIIGIVRHLTLAKHCNPIGHEAAGGGLILKPTKVIVVPDGIELGIVLEAVDGALSLDGVGALHVAVVGEEELLGPVEAAAASDGLLGAVVPPDPDLHVGPAAVGLDRLHLGHVRRLRGVGGPHQDRVSGLYGFVGALDGVGIEGAFGGWPGLGHC